MGTVKLALRRCIVLSLAAIVGAGVLTPTAQAAEFKKEHKLQVNVGPSFYWGIGATKFADLVKEKTDDRILVKPYFGSALLKGAQLNAAQMVAKGVIDCAYESTINISPVIPEANVFHLPFFIYNFKNLDKMKAGQSGRAVFAAMEKVGLSPLAWAENGFRQITHSKRPIEKPEDPLIIYWNQKQWNEFPADIQKAIREAAEASGRFEIALSRAGLDEGQSLRLLQEEYQYTMEVPNPIEFMESNISPIFPSAPPRRSPSTSSSG